MSVIPPRGFRLAGVHCGIKRNPAKEDVTLIVADAPAVAAGVYTQNLVFAAPVALDRQRTPSDNIRAILANSGNANACTGQRGLDDARRMSELAAQACDIQPEHVLVLSTGIIGEFLPLVKIEAGANSAAQRLATDEAAFVAAARGITTTDKSHKMAARVIELSSGPVRISGMAKGAGMIGPRMATMLGILLTDAALTPGDAQQALTWAVDDSFNCISVEGHMSTNDTVLLLASGAASRSPLAGADLAAFRQALLEVCIDLARAIPDDGEGASHLITIEVRGCATRADAHRIAKTIAESALVKTAIAGGDPNWGRIVSAAGYAGPRFDPAKVNLTINGHQLYRAGAPVPFDARTVSESIKSARETHVVLELAEGDASVRFWTSDLTAEYLRINTEYHT
jgi:glutamate N-acetyltransferase/amino-acid N-acetyltransferase